MLAYYKLHAINAVMEQMIRDKAGNEQAVFNCEQNIERLQEMLTDQRENSLILIKSYFLYPFLFFSSLLALGIFLTYWPRSPVYVFQGEMTNTTQWKSHGFVNATDCVTQTLKKDRDYSEKDILSWCKSFDDDAGVSFYSTFFPLFGTVYVGFFMYLVAHMKSPHNCITSRFLRRIYYDISTLSTEELDLYQEILQLAAQLGLKSSINIPLDQILIKDIREQLKDFKDQLAELNYPNLFKKLENIKSRLNQLGTEELFKRGIVTYDYQLCNLDTSLSNNDLALATIKDNNELLGVLKREIIAIQNLLSDLYTTWQDHIPKYQQIKLHELKEELANDEILDIESDPADVEPSPGTALLTSLWQRCRPKVSNWLSRRWNRASVDDGDKRGLINEASDEEAGLTPREPDETSKLLPDSPSCN